MKKVFKAMGIILFLLIAVPVTLNISGFCWSKHGWLSDEQQIRLAIETVSALGPNEEYLSGTQYNIFRKHQTPEYKSIEYFVEANYEPIPYATPEKFIKENPNCCRTEGFVEEISTYLFDLDIRAGGQRAEAVRLEYPARFRNKRTGHIIEIPNFYEWVSIRNCYSPQSGQVYREDIP